MPHVKHPKLDYTELKQKSTTPAMSMADFSRQAIKKSYEQNSASGSRKALPTDEDKYRKQRRLAENITPIQGHHVRSPPPEPTRRSRKRRSHEKSLANIVSIATHIFFFGRRKFFNLYWFWVSSLNNIQCLGRAYKMFRGNRRESFGSPK